MNDGLDRLAFDLRYGSGIVSACCFAEPHDTGEQSAEDPDANLFVCDRCGELCGLVHRDDIAHGIARQLEQI